MIYAMVHGLLVPASELEGPTRILLEALNHEGEPIIPLAATGR